MERLLLYLLTEDIPSAISFSIIALLPLTALAVWKGSRVLFIAVAFVCLNGGLWGGVITVIDALWHGEFSDSHIAQLAACITAIALGLLAVREAKRRHQGELTHLTTAPAIFSVFWLLFFGAFAGEHWKSIYDELEDARRAQPESWPGALGSALDATRRQWNDQFREARAEALLAFGDPVHSPDRVVVWAVVPGPATASLPMITHHASALVHRVHHWQREKGFPCRSDFGIVTEGTLEAVGREQFFGADGRRTPPRATYENHFNFYPEPDTTAQGPRCHFVHLAGRRSREG